MTGKPTPIDTNLIIRYLTNNTPHQAERVEMLFKKAKKNELIIADVLFAEIVWVLQSFYNLKKDEVVEKLEGLFTLKCVKMNRKLLSRSVLNYRSYNISYTDAYLLAYSSVNGNSKVYSFDKGLDTQKEVKRLEP